MKIMKLTKKPFPRKKNKNREKNGGKCSHKSMYWKTQNVVSL